MTPPARLPVVLMWHMHQPQYRDALTGQYVLPWTYLHAIKDYVDMAAHLEAVPAARAVVNFTPVLIEQLEEIAARIVQHLESGAALPDPVLALLGPAEVTQAAAQRLELLRACLRAQRTHMIERFPAYLELATLAESFATPELVGYASDQYMHDLAVWRDGAPHRAARCGLERTGPRLHAGKQARTAGAHRPPRRQHHSALSRLERCGAMRAFAHAVCAPDRTALDRCCRGAPVAADGNAAARALSRRRGAGGVAHARGDPRLHGSLWQEARGLLAVRRSD
jgi:hypothetical protein